MPETRKWSRPAQLVVAAPRLRGGGGQNRRASRRGGARGTCGAYSVGAAASALVDGDWPVGSASGNGKWPGWRGWGAVARAGNAAGGTAVARYGAADDAAGDAAGGTACGTAAVARLVALAAYGLATRRPVRSAKAAAPPAGRAGPLAKQRQGLPGRHLHHVSPGNRCTVNKGRPGCYIHMLPLPMWHTLRQRLHASVHDINETLRTMALDSRLMPSPAAKPKPKATAAGLAASSASTPSLRSRDAALGLARGDVGGNVRVVVRVRAFLQRGESFGGGGTEKRDTGDREEGHGGQRGPRADTDDQHATWQSSTGARAASSKWTPSRS